MIWDFFCDQIIRAGASTTHTVYVSVHRCPFFSKSHDLKYMYYDETIEFHSLGRKIYINMILNVYFLRVLCQNSIQGFDA